MSSNPSNPVCSDATIAALVAAADAERASVDAERAAAVERAVDAERAAAAEHIAKLERELAEAKYAADEAQWRAAQRAAQRVAQRAAQRVDRVATPEELDTVRAWLEEAERRDELSDDDENAGYNNHNVGSPLRIVADAAAQRAAEPAAAKLQKLQEELFEHQIAAQKAQAEYYQQQTRHNAEKARRDAAKQAEEQAKEQKLKQLKKQIAMAVPMATDDQRKTLLRDFEVASGTPSDRDIQMAFIAGFLAKDKQVTIAGKMWIEHMSFTTAYTEVVGTSQSTAPPTSSSTITAPPTSSSARRSSDEDELWLKLAEAFGAEVANQMRKMNPSSARMYALMYQLGLRGEEAKQIAKLLDTEGTSALGKIADWVISKIRAFEQSSRPSAPRSQPSGPELITYVNAPGLKSGTSHVLRNNDMFNRGQIPIVVNTSGTMVAADGIKYDAGYLALGQAGETGFFMYN